VRKSSLSALLEWKKRTDKKAYFYFIFNDMMLQTMTPLDSDAKTQASIAKKGRTFKFCATVPFAHCILDTTNVQNPAYGVYSFEITEKMSKDKGKKKDEKQKTRGHAIYCESVEERDLAMKEIGAVIAEQVRKKAQEMM